MPVAVPAVSPTSVSNQVQVLANMETSGTLMNTATDSAGNPSKIGFFGVGPVVQPSGGEAAVTRGQGAGTIATFASTATPASVATLTSAEVTLTPAIGSGAVYTITSTDVVVLNKPTSQAGLGYGNVRYASATTIALSFNNITAGTLTPTTTQIYGIVGLRGLANSSTITVTPAAVVTKTTAEQQFTVAGLTPGMVAVVNKPTTNAGLDIVGVRVVAANTLGITFANFTAGTLTPTAAEAYGVVGLVPADAASNTMMFQAAIVGTQTIAPNTTGQVTLTSGNFAAQDTPVGVAAPFQAGLAAMNGQIFTTTEAVTFVNATATTATPTAAEFIVTTLNRQNPVAPLVIYSVTLTPAGVATLTTAEQTFVVTGLVAGSPVWVNKPSVQPGLGIVGARVSSANNIAINYLNTTGATLTPASETYVIANFQLPIDTTTANAWIEQTTGALGSDSTLVDSIRAALVSLGLISGST